MPIEEIRGETNPIIAASNPSIWFPSVPRASLTFWGPRASFADGPQRPLSWVAFEDNEQGSQQVSSISIWCDHDDEPLGIQISSTNPKECPLTLVYPGYEQGEQQEMKVDAAAGEKLTGIETVYTRTETFLGFKVRYPTSHACLIALTARNFLGIHQFSEDLLVSRVPTAI